MSGIYVIDDEPKPGALGSWVVNPIWPLFAIMFAGTWLALPWFVFNAFAVGSPTRWRETAIAAIGFAGKVALTFTLIAAANKGVVPEPAVKYLAVGIAVWKLGVAYWLYFLQARSFHLFEYYGGTVRNGIIAVIGGKLLAPVLITNNLLAILLG